MSASEWLSRVRDPIRVPGGVGDPGAERVYVAGVHGNLEAVELDSGALLWTTDAAQIPVLGLRAAVLAAGLEGDDEVRLRVLSAEDGAILLESDRAPRAPGGDWTPLRCRGGRKNVRIEWLSRPVGRHPKVVEVGMEFPTHRGSVALDLEDGSVSEVRWDEPAPPWPEGADELEFLPDTQGNSGPWWVGRKIVGLAYDAERDPTALRLHRWNKDGAALRSRILLRRAPERGFLEHHRTSDDRHVYLLRCNDRPQGDAPPGSTCEWLVFRVPEGERVLDLPMSSAIGSPMTVLGDRLLYEWAGPPSPKGGPAPREIRAADIAEGTVLWSHGLRAWGVGPKG